MLITQNPRELSMEENLEWLIEPKAELDSRLFTKDKRLLPSIQKRLLHRANVLFQACIAPMTVFTIKDVILCGSTDSYFYNPFSDIDMVVLLKYNCDEKLFGDSYRAHRFAIMKVKNFYEKKRMLKLDGRFIDVKTALYIKERQLFSVLNNEWIIEPSTSVMEGVDTSKVLADAREILHKMEDMKIDQFERVEGKFKMEDLRKMQSFYNEIVAMKKTSAHNLLINKLLSYAGRLQEFQKFYQEEAIKTLSF